MEIEAVTIREVEWTPALTSLLTHPAADECLSLLESEVRRGVSQLWECRSGPHCLYLVTRLEANPREWVICYARGTGIATFAPMFLRLADAKRWPLRVHTESLAVVRLLRRHAFRQAEYVLRR